MIDESDSKIEGIIHVSRWAITKKVGNKIQKIYLYDNLAKIQKEVFLLEKSLGYQVELYFDESSMHWVCESDFLELGDIGNSSFTKELHGKLKQVIFRWDNDSCYTQLITDEWLTKLVPWYCTLLEQYVPNSENQVLWLKNSNGKHFIHGDFTLSNVFFDVNFNLVVIDFENATYGPLLWDETTLVYSFIERKQYAIAETLFDIFLCESEMLKVICSIRLAQSIRKNQKVSFRKEAYDYIFKNF